jgi:ubiquinone/menaquinone biosynthesis C-methylase UbiE
MIDLTKLDPATRAQQLGNPQGEIGVALADSMNKTNGPLNEAVYKRVGPKPGEHIFEVGFGNGKLLPRLLALAPGLNYTGIDVSEAMVGEAEAFNRSLLDAGRVSLRAASVSDIPFPNDSFDRAVTVNTIYFWPEPSRGLAEIRRVLRPNGTLLVAAMTPETAAKYPFTRFGFRLYDEPQLCELHDQAGFRHVDVELYRETVPKADGTGTMEREYYFIIAGS